MAKETPNRRIILHVDMNSYFASVEIAKDPTLRGKPLAIAGNVKERRGIIVTCSYEARAHGIKTTMPLWEAKKRCPELVVLPPNHELYRKTAYEMFELLSEFTPLIEPVSIDEAYMDITDYNGEYAIEVANQIQQRLLDEMQLPCSIGIAPNKFLAKMASDMKKPLGITILRKRDIHKFLWPLEVREMHGVGRKTAEKLNAIGIFTIKDLSQGNETLLKSEIGTNGIQLKERANGIDLREVNPDSILEFKSIGNSTTLPRDEAEESVLMDIFLKLCEKVSSRLKKKSVLATNIQITLRYGNRKTVTRSKKLLNPVQEGRELLHEVANLFFAHWTGDPIRLLGVTAIDVVDESDAMKQLDLFSYEKDAKKEPLNQVVESLQEKFGVGVISLGSKKQNEEQMDEKARLYEGLKKKLEQEPK